MSSTCAQLVDLLLRHGQAQLHLGLGQRDPQPAPQAVSRIVRKEAQHRRGGVAPAQRALIGCVRVGHKGHTSCLFSPGFAAEAVHSFFHYNSAKQGCQRMFRLNLPARPEENPNIPQSFALCVRIFNLQSAGGYATMALQGFLCACRAQPLRENVHPGPFFRDPALSIWF